MSKVGVTAIVEGAVIEKPRPRVWGICEDVGAPQEADVEVCFESFVGVLEEVN
jgi:hypothetical protein